MMNITIKTSGSLDIDSIMKKTIQVAQNKALAQAQERLVGVTCPEHGTVPVPELVTEPGKDDFNITVPNLCCTAFRETVVAKLKG